MVSFGERGEGVGRLNGEPVTEESSHPVSAIAITPAAASPSCLRPGRITMGAGVDIQSQVHELGGAVSELSLSETVYRIRILLDRLQLETGAGRMIRQVSEWCNGLLSLYWEYGYERDRKSCFIFFLLHMTNERARMLGAFEDFI